MTSYHLADALLVIAETFLAGQDASADNPDVYQVIVHVGTDALAAATRPTAQPGNRRVSAETPTTIPGHPADPLGGTSRTVPAISVSTAQMLACTATLSWMIGTTTTAPCSTSDGGAEGRAPALRRAARERDHCRCRYPGCESRRVDLHHIQHWINGGRTSLENLISLCKYHHTLVHERGYLIASAPGSAFTFYRPDGTLILSSPALPAGRRGHRRLPRRRHHPRHHHPRLVRRAPRPGLRHLRVLRPRRIPGPPARSGRTAGPASKSLRVRTGGRALAAYGDRS